MRSRFSLAEKMIDRLLKETDPQDPQQLPKADPMIDMPGTPGDDEPVKPFIPGVDGNPEFDPMGQGFGKM